MVPMAAGQGRVPALPFEVFVSLRRLRVANDVGPATAPFGRRCPRMQLNQPRGCRVPKDRHWLASTAPKEPADLGRLVGAWLLTHHAGITDRLAADEDGLPVPRCCWAAGRARRLVLDRFRAPTMPRIYAAQSSSPCAGLAVKPQSIDDLVDHLALGTHGWLQGRTGHDRDLGVELHVLLSKGFTRRRRGADSWTRPGMVMCSAPTPWRRRPRRGSRIPCRRIHSIFWSLR